MTPEAAVYMATHAIADYHGRTTPSPKDRELARRVISSLANHWSGGISAPPPPAHRQKDPPTSVTAAIEGLGRFTNQRARMLVPFGQREAHELKGLNPDQAGELAQLTNGCYWKRFSELRFLGLIEDTGEVRPGRSGHGQRVCRLTIWGEVALSAIRGVA